MAYITQSVYNHIVKKFDVDVEIDIDFFMKFIFDNAEVYNFFNSYERRKLYISKYLLENESILVTLKQVYELPDSKKYVFSKGGKVKYHLFKDCSALNREFLDFIIPPEISEGKVQLVDEYRSWFKSQNFKEDFENGTLNHEMVILKYNSSFAKKHGLAELNKDYKLIQRIDNTGSREYTFNFNYDSFKQKVDDLILERHYLCCSPTLNYLSKFDYLISHSQSDIEEKVSQILNEDFIKNYGFSNLINFWKKHKNLKAEMLKLLANFFKWHFSLENKVFEPEFLNNLGLSCCRLCIDRKWASMPEKNLQ